MSETIVCPECGSDRFYVIVSQRQVWDLDPETGKQTTPGESWDADELDAVFTCEKCEEQVPEDSDLFNRLNARLF